MFILECIYPNVQKIKLAYQRVKGTAWVWIMDMEWKLQDELVTYSTVLSLQFPGVTEENQDKTKGE